MPCIKSRSKKGKAVPIRPIQDGVFDLYCADYLDHYFEEAHSRKTISFTNDNYGEVTGSPGARSSALGDQLISPGAYDDHAL
jgi:hypothetical protein